MGAFLASAGWRRRRAGRRRGHHGDGGSGDREESAAAADLERQHAGDARLEHRVAADGGERLVAHGAPRKELSAAGARRSSARCSTCCSVSTAPFSGSSRTAPSTRPLTTSRRRCCAAAPRRTTSRRSARWVLMRASRRCCAWKRRRRPGRNHVAERHALRRGRTAHERVCSSIRSATITVSALHLYSGIYLVNVF